MTVTELLVRISSQELSEWMAFYIIKDEDMQAEMKQAKQGKSSGGDGE